MFVAAADPVAGGEVLRLATYNVSLERDGPGLLYRELLEGSPQLDALGQVIGAARADLILLTGIDNDGGDLALAVLAGRLTPAYGYWLGLPGNEGVASELDLDGDGRTGGWADNLGFGKFPGHAGMAVLSRYPVHLRRDHGALLWRDVPGAGFPQTPGGAFLGPTAEARLPVFSHTFAELELATAAGPLAVFVTYLTPPVFDGPEDLNGLRNAAELIAATDILRAAEHRGYAVLADLNNDPDAGEGHKMPLARFLGNLTQASEHRTAETSNWAHVEQPMRVDYVLAAGAVTFSAAGVLSPDADPARWGLAADTLHAASDHWLVWADIVID